MDEEDFGSDSSDDDYIPDDGERGSEEELSGDEEDLTVLGVDEEGKPIEKGDRKQNKGKKKEAPLVRKRTGGIRLEGDEESGKEEEKEDNYNKELAAKVQQEQEEKKKDTEKKKADDLWAGFMKDVGGPKPKSKPVSSGLGSFGSLTKKVPEKSKTVAVSTSRNDAEAKVSPEVKPDSKAEKITITKEYDFAGETVRITKEYDAHSKEAKSELKKQEEHEKQSATAKAGPSIPGLSGLSAGVKRVGGGLGSILGKIGKKPKMGTLEKSKLDWESFKDKEGISEELQIHNRGKDGYIGRKNFLERTDLRQFEIEKDLRTKNRTKTS